MQYDPERFLKAQEAAYPVALAEIKQGRKRSHWMWYIFPQLHGLGFSDISMHYAIRDLEEANAYLLHPLLGPRLVAICTELLALPGKDAHAVFGSPDDLKLKSSMTLFALASHPDPVFQKVLDHFFRGQKDPKTIQLLNSV